MSQPGTTAAAGPDSVRDGAEIRRVAGASLLGSVVEWYDFFLYGTMAALVFNSQFFPTFDPLVGTMIAFATFAAGFVTRPLGGFIFGHFGDRVGRKKMLVLTMLIMGLSTFAMGLLPTYESIGVWAPMLLLLLRMLQGIGLGGEWGGAVLLCVEHAPDDRRGWFSSLAPARCADRPADLHPRGHRGDPAARGGVPVVGLARALPRPIVLVAVGLVIRLRIDEPPAFKEIEEADATAALPLLEVFRKYPKVTLLAMGARMSECVTFNVYNAFLVTYAVTVLGLADIVALDALLVASVVGFFVILAAGRLSDRFGRRPGLRDRRRARAGQRRADLRAGQHRERRADHPRRRRRLGPRRLHHVRPRGRDVRRAVPDPRALLRHVRGLPDRRHPDRRRRPAHRHAADRARGAARCGRSRST